MLEKTGFDGCDDKFSRYEARQELIESRILREYRILFSFRINQTGRCIFNFCRMVLNS